MVYCFRFTTVKIPVGMFILIVFLLAAEFHFYTLHIRLLCFQVWDLINSRSLIQRSVEGMLITDHASTGCLCFLMPLLFCHKSRTVLCHVVYVIPSECD